ncbi:MAG: anhydro-N-acetylmuramic acid kinase [Candidatus Eiseniibacteriota bacterium]
MARRPARPAAGRGKGRSTERGKDRGKGRAKQHEKERGKPRVQERARKSTLVVGLMTGTSVDGIEAALVALSGEPPGLTWKLRAHRSLPLDPLLTARILACARGDAFPASEFTALDAALGETYAAAVLELLGDAGADPRDVAAIGLHGQTIFHRGPRDADAAAAGGGGLTWQIGSASVLAERTGIRVLHDFRSADIAAGGEGAPLVPYVDWLLFRSAHVARGLLNLGGIANLTAMPARAQVDEVLAFDTGPGNMLLDGIVRRATGGRVSYDEDGRRAVGGRPDEELLAEALADPFFDQPPPRSTGRERFGDAYLERWFAAGKARGLSEADLLVTAAMLSASAVANAIEEFVALRFPLDAVYASGGGTHNPVLMASLAAALDPIELHTTDELGLPVDAKEAVAFAVLAFESLNGRPGNLPGVTGAARPLVLGSITLDRKERL